jgi:RimJ/RimL family protein N-acetyltransferase
VGAAIRAGFVAEGTLRGTAWVDGIFMDEVILGQLASEWQQAAPSQGRRSS